LSNAPGITDLFFHEVEKCRIAATQTEEINTSEGFRDYIRSLFAAHGMGEIFDQALSQLMENSGLTFF
jgi:hypothetical protein